MFAVQTSGSIVVGVVGRWIGRNTCSRQPSIWRAGYYGGLILTILPLELFFAVFDHLRLRDAITASHVCHVWREVLTGRPSIWNIVKCSSSGGVLHTLLERSCEADLDLELHFTLSDGEEVFQCLAQHLYRCTRLTLRVWDIVPDANFAAGFRSALCHPAPRLRVLRLFDRYNLLHNSLDGALLFGGIAPRLNLLKLYANPRLFSVCAGDALKHVERLSFRPSDTLDDISIQDIGQLFALFPNLHGFAIELESWEEDARSRRTPRLSLPTGLNFFAIIARPGTFNPAVLLQRFRHQDARKVTILYNRGVFTVSPLFDLLRTDGVTASREAMRLTSTRTGHHVYVSVSFEGLPAQYSIRCPRPGGCKMEFLFGNLAKLTLHERLFSCGKPLPAAPVLGELSIRMSKRAAIAFDGILCLPRDSGRTFVCPALKRIRFSGPANLPPIHLDPALIGDYIERHLQLSGAERPVLILRRAWILQNNAADIARLLGMVCDIGIDELEPDVTQGRVYETLLSWD